MISDQSTKSQTIVRPASPIPAPTRSSNRSWESCAALPECQVPLTGLEVSISFDGLGEPICYDAQRGLLRYRGTMSHASFLHLQQQSRERQYQRALEQLFVVSAMPQVPATSPTPWLVGTGAAALAAVAIGGLWYSLGGRPNVQSPASEKMATSAISTLPSAQLIPVKASEADGSHSPAAETAPHSQDR